MLPLIRKTIKGPVRHLINLLTDREYRKWSYLETRYRLCPRYTEFKASISNFKLTGPDPHSFLAAYKDIFLKNTYKFKTDNPQPYIIDIGANIGISALYFKKIFPEAKIIAIEADPHIYKYLHTNVYNNGCTDIRLINKAAWFENTVLKFYPEGADAGRIAYRGDSNLIMIPAFDVSILLQNKSVDMLKIDIEGAETKVLNVCKKHLKNVKNIIVEYHSKADEKQELNKLLDIMLDEGFRIHIHAIKPSISPLIHRETYSGFDQQLNIFAWKVPEQ